MGGSKRLPVYIETFLPRAGRCRLGDIRQSSKRRAGITAAWKAARTGAVPCRRHQSRDAGRLHSGRTSRRGILCKPSKNQATATLAQACRKVTEQGSGPFDDVAVITLCGLASAPCRAPWSLMPCAPPNRTITRAWAASTSGRLKRHWASRRSNSG